MIHVWMCETCKTIFDEKSLAEGCEYSHKVRLENIKIKSAGWEHQFGYGMQNHIARKFPKFIRIQFSEDYGDSASYKLDYLGFKDT